MGLSESHQKRPTLAVDTPICNGPKASHPWGVYSLIVVCRDTRASVVASGGADGTVRVWRCSRTAKNSTDTPETDIQRPGGRDSSHAGLPGAAYFEPVDCNWECVRTLGIVGRDEDHPGNCHIGVVTSLLLLDSVCPGQLLASAGLDSTVRIWNLDEGTCVATLRGHRSCVFALTRLSCGALISGGGAEGGGDEASNLAADNAIKVWRNRRVWHEASSSWSGGGTSWTITDVFKGHTNGVRSFAETPFGLASGSYDHTIRLWDVESGTCTQVMSTPGLGEVLALRYIPGTNVLLSGDLTYGRPGGLAVWDLKTYSCTRRFPAHKNGIMSIAYCSQCQGPLVVTSSMDKSVRVWAQRDLLMLLIAQTSAASASVIPVQIRSKTKDLPEAQDDSCAAVHSVTDVSAAVPTETVATVSSASVPFEPVPVQTMLGHRNFVYALAASPCGSLVFSGDKSGVIKCWAFKSSNTSSGVHPASKKGGVT